jgi:hypothetical protein
MPVVRHGRNMKKKRIAEWPAAAIAPDELAAQVTYVGSTEHKDHPSPAGPPGLRHNDASPCDPRYATFEEPMRSLDGRLYEARLVNQELGTYKAYKLEKIAELPEDPSGLLETIAPWQL